MLNELVQKNENRSLEYLSVYIFYFLLDWVCSSAGLKACLLTLVKRGDIAPSVESPAGTVTKDGSVS